MKKLLPLVVLATFAYLTPLYPVYAVDSTSSSKPLRNINKLAVKEASLAARMEDRQEKLASRAAMLMQKLAAFKDKNKAKKVELINDGLAKINKTRTDLMLRHYEKMVEILTKVEDRVNEAAAGGKDMTAARSSISQARSALNEVKAALDTQVTKDYTINVSSESAVRVDAMVQRQQLFSDLKAIHDKLVTARKAIAEAISLAMSTIKGVSNGQ